MNLIKSILFALCASVALVANLSANSLVYSIQYPTPFDGLSSHQLPGDSYNVLGGSSSGAITGKFINTLAPGDTGYLVWGDEAYGLAFTGGVLTDAYFGNPTDQIGGLLSINVAQSTLIPFVMQFESSGGSTTFQLWLSGVKVAESVYANPFAVGYSGVEEHTFLGGTNVGNYYSGQLNDFKVFDFALPPSMIAQLMQTPTYLLPETGPTALLMGAAMFGLMALNRRQFVVTS